MEFTGWVSVRITVVLLAVLGLATVVWAAAPRVTGLVVEWTSTTTPRCTRGAAGDLARNAIFSVPPGAPAKIIDRPTGACRDADGSSIYLAEAHYELTRPGDDVLADYVKAAREGG